jgi:O-antigen ligase
VAAVRSLEPTRGFAWAMAGMIGLAAFAGAWAVSQAPFMAVAVLMVIVAAAWTVTHMAVATSVLVASFYFEGYLSEGYGLVTPVKLVGLVAVLAWGIAWATDRRPVRTAPHLWLVIGLALSIVLSLPVAQHQPQAILVAIRYAMFFVLFFLVLQGETRREKVERLLDVVVAASAIASALGLWTYFSGAVDRASGPLENPNDFAFLLASSVPLALHRVHGTSLARRWLVTGALLTIFAAVLATFSRAAIVGLVVAAGWAILTGRLRLRWGVMACAGLIVAGLATYAVQPELVENTFSQKQDISQENVDSRVRYWSVAVEQFASSPLVGVGPGNYEARYTEYQYPVAGVVNTTHNAYLNVLAELGIVGTSMFVGFLIVSWRSLRQRFPAQPELDLLMGALAAGFVVALVGSLFMTEQFYPPLWFLAALGALLVSGQPGQDDDGPRRQGTRPALARLRSG